MSDLAGLPLIKAFKIDLFPLDRLDPGGDLEELLSKILVTSYEEEIFDQGFGERFEIGLTVASEAVFALVGLEGFALVLGGPSASLITFGVTMQPTGWQVRLGAGARLRFPRSILKAVRKDGEQWVDDPLRAHAELDISAGIVVDQDWNVTFDGSNAFRLDSVMVADSGLVIEGDVAIDLSETTGLAESATLGLPPTWRGVVFRSLAVYLPPIVTEVVPIANLSFTNFHIGSGGVTGTISLNGTPGPGTIDGFPFQPTSLGVELRQNCLVRAEIEGQIKLSFFDEPLDVIVGFDLSGSFSVAVKSDSGLITLHKPDLLDLAVESVGFVVDNGVFTVALSGEITPLFGGLDWPALRVQQLAIDSNGNVRLEGGWLDLREQYSLNFHGFRLEISKLGFGKTEDGGKWIGFSGGLKLVEALPAGASVEGLRLTWYEGQPDRTKITLNGVGVEFEIPAVLSFKGAISYRELDVATPSGSIEKVRRFDGDIKLALVTLGLEIDATLVVGSAKGSEGTYTFFAIYLGVELPAGIPLWSTGLALYGMAGLFAQQMEPDKKANEEWYEGWYKRPAIGVIDLKEKWVNRRGSLALGAGVTIGTVADNGFTFSGKTLLVIIFPGPILMIEGKANMLRERAKLDEEPIFRAIAVLDGRAGNLTLGLDAQYKLADGGELIDIHGSAEAFFDFHRADAWHIYIGQQEHEKRVRAPIFKGLFEANAYFMLDPNRLAMGAWVGFNPPPWQFGPLRAALEAWLEGNALLSFKPPQFHGDLWLHGGVELRAWKFGVGMGVDARITADVFRPYHLRGEFDVSLDLPWPLSDPSATIVIEWGPELTPPPLPLPLKEIAVEHLKVTTKWPLPRGTLLLPNYNSNGDGFVDSPTGPRELADLSIAPVVPLDGRPRLTFGRHVNDDARIGMNVQTDVWERIGDPSKNEGPVRVRYGLQQVQLHRRVGNQWQLVAQAPAPANTAKLYGSWAPLPPPEGGGAHSGQTKLWLWSKTPFDYTRNTSRAWDEWFVDHFREYPCAAPSEREICCDFEALEPLSEMRSPWICSIASRTYISLSWLFADTDVVTITKLDAPAEGLDRALCLPVSTGGELSTNNKITLVNIPPGTATVTVSRTDNNPIELIGYDGDNRVIARDVDSSGVKTHLRVRSSPINETDFHHVILSIPEDATPRSSDLCLLEICVEGIAFGKLCYNFYTRVIPLPWQCPDHPEVVLAAPRTAAVQCVLRRLREPVAGMSQALCFSPPPIILKALPSTASESIRDLVAVELTVPVRSVKFTLTHRSGVNATAYDSNGNLIEIVQQETGLPTDPHLTIIGEDMKRIVLSADTSYELCLLEVRVLAVEDLNRHTQQELARWSEQDAVLEPNTTYRITAVTTLRAQGDGELVRYSQNKTLTEYAYFRTEEPPGIKKLQPPINHPANTPFDSGLDDLTRYVRYTIPNTTPAVGDKPRLPRPVYRAYDIGVQFNENYVDLMYRLAQRDLGLYLYDNNNRPARDAGGQLIIMDNRWGQAEELTLTEGEERWLALIESSKCTLLKPSTIRHDTALISATEGRVLEADTVYEARLIPLLLHEDFSEDLAGWRFVGGAWNPRNHKALQGAKATASGKTVKLDGTPDLSVLDPDLDIIILANDTARPFKQYRIRSFDNVAKTVEVDSAPTLSASPSRWEIPQLGGVEQTSNTETVLIRNERTWTDYRLSTYMRSADSGAIGLVFRFQDVSNYYRFSMSGQGKFRRLEKLTAGQPALLKEDQAAYAPNHDYLITVEAIGSSLRVYQEGTLVFDVNDTSYASGAVGLYSGGSNTARFSDVRVDDYRGDAPIAYRFSFTTSKYANFFHYLHSFQDETWRTPLAAMVDTNPFISVAAPLTPTMLAPPSEAEARAYEALASHVFGAAALQNPPEVQVTRVERDGKALTYLVQGPEPIDWKRTSLEVLHATRWDTSPSLPGAIKLTDVAFGRSQPNEEAITLLLREATELTGYRIEYHTFADIVLNEPFDVLLPNRWTFINEGNQAGPSQWEVKNGELQQLSKINDGNSDVRVLDKLGTYALAGDKSWRDYCTHVQFTSDQADGAIGVMFRYQDENNYYRFSMDHNQRYRRLIKKVAGTVTELWKDDQQYTLGQAHAFTVECMGRRLTGYLNGIELFEVDDNDAPAGRIGLYCWNNDKASFTMVRIEALTWKPYYQFGQEARLPMGTRIQVFAGSETDAPSERGGAVRRFSAPVGERGQPRLSGKRADLRLVTQDGTISHMRTFLSESAYTQVDVRVLRKADGTGFMILPATDPILGPQQYRLRMQYRRNNKQADSTSEVFSQAGDSNMEQVTIDIP